MSSYRCGLLASSISVSCRIVSVLPRSAHLPALLVVGRGGLLCGSLSSRAVRCFEFRSSGSLVPLWLIVSPRVRRPLPAVLACFPASVSCGMAAAGLSSGGGRVPLAGCLLAPPRLVRWRRGARACVLLALDMIIAPLPISRSGAIFPVSVVFLVRFYSSMMA